MAFQTQEHVVGDEAVPRRRRTGLVVGVLLVLLLAVAAGLGAGALERNRPSQYGSEAVLLIDQEPALSISHDDGVFDKLARLRVKYVDITETTQFADLVSGRTGVDADRVHHDLSAGAKPLSLLLTIDASDQDRATAQHLAQSAAETLQDSLTNEQASLGILRQDRITLTVVSPASTAKRTAPTTSRAIAVGVIVGLAVLGAGLVVVAAVRRRSR